MTGTLYNSETHSLYTVVKKRGTVVTSEWGWCSFALNNLPFLSKPNPQPKNIYLFSNYNHKIVHLCDHHHWFHNLVNLRMTKERRRFGYRLRYKVQKYFYKVLAQNVLLYYNMTWLIENLDSKQNVSNLFFSIGITHIFIGS